MLALPEGVHAVFGVARAVDLRSRRNAPQDRVDIEATRHGSRLHRLARG
jgi:hypothetical protein